MYDRLCTIRTKLGSTSVVLQTRSRLSNFVTFSRLPHVTIRALTNAQTERKYVGYNRTETTTE